MLQHPRHVFETKHRAGGIQTRHRAGKIETRHRAGEIEIPAAKRTYAEAAATAAQRKVGGKLLTRRCQLETNGDPG